MRREISRIAVAVQAVRQLPALQKVAVIVMLLAHKLDVRFVIALEWREKL